MTKRFSVSSMPALRAVLRDDLATQEVLPLDELLAPTLNQLAPTDLARLRDALEAMQNGSTRSFERADTEDPLLPSEDAWLESDGGQPGAVGPMPLPPFNVVSAGPAQRPEPFRPRYMPRATQAAAPALPPEPNRAALDLLAVLADPSTIKATISLVLGELGSQTVSIGDRSASPARLLRLLAVLSARAARAASLLALSTGGRSPTSDLASFDQEAEIDALLTELTADLVDSSDNTIVSGAPTMPFGILAPPLADLESVVDYEDYAVEYLDDYDPSAFEHTLESSPANEPPEDLWPDIETAEVEPLAAPEAPKITSWRTR